MGPHESCRTTLPSEEPHETRGFGEPDGDIINIKIMIMIMMDGEGDNDG
jgi:hypothetical protein